MNYYYIIHYYIIQYLYKIAKINFCPPLNYFEIIPHYHNTRNKNNYFICQPNCNLFKKAFSYLAPNLINNIDLKNVNNLNELKQLLKSNKITLNNKIIEPKII